MSPVRLPEVLKNIVFAPELLEVKTWRMEAIWLSLPAQNNWAAVELKRYSALGQAARGNSELKEWKNSITRWELLPFNKDRAIRPRILFSWCSWWYFGVQCLGAEEAVRQDQKQEEGLYSEHNFSSQVVQKLAAPHMQQRPTYQS